MELSYHTGAGIASRSLLPAIRFSGVPGTETIGLPSAGFHTLSGKGELCELFCGWYAGRCGTRPCPPRALTARLIPIPRTAEEANSFLSIVILLPAVFR